MALSTLKELTTEAPFLDIISDEALLADKLTTLTLQARDYLGKPIAFKNKVNKVFMTSKTQPEIDVTS